MIAPTHNKVVIALLLFVITQCSAEENKELVGTVEARKACYHCDGSRTKAKWKYYVPIYGDNIENHACTGCEVKTEMTCEKCDGTGEVSGALWGKNNCPECYGSKAEYESTGMANNTDPETAEIFVVRDESNDIKYFVFKRETGKIERFNVCNNYRNHNYDSGDDPVHAPCSWSFSKGLDAQRAKGDWVLLELSGHRQRMRNRWFEVNNSRDFLEFLVSEGVLPQGVLYHAFRHAELCETCAGKRYVPDNGIIFSGNKKCSDCEGQGTHWRGEEYD